MLRSLKSRRSLFVVWKKKRIGGGDMRRSFQLISLCVVLGILAAGCGKSDFRKLPDSEVNASMRASAQDLASRILTSWRDGRFEPLGEEATLALQSGLTPEMQKQSYEQIRGMFGDFQSLEYAETWMPTDGSSLFIFRFKGRFARTETAPEIRVVLDGEGKLSGLWIKPWMKGIQ
jgi:hypothetical protein